MGPCSPNTDCHRLLLRRMLPCSITASWSTQRDHFQARLALVEPTQQAPPKQRRSSG
jgi:hypothetical protein